MIALSIDVTHFPGGTTKKRDGSGFAFASIVAEEKSGATVFSTVEMLIRSPPCIGIEIDSGRFGKRSTSDAQERSLLICEKYRT
ncbi:hypothetical protein K239x_24720 [Planctomycetes bacterium K23_9]|uniref:Uncharacterized protein n=1 Tax=Stieleria marina TaxID=1930275 RepID=A0A517NTR5_9BACT|nr:hypothetical protein K239x_24720 [Planctomycetes bacterium K23_9]